MSSITHKTTFEEAYPLARCAAEVWSRRAVQGFAISAADRADIKQEAMLSVFRALSKFDASKASLRTFTERVIANRAVTAIRAGRRQPRFLAMTDVRHLNIYFHESRIHRTIDVTRRVRQLPAGERLLAQLLMGHSPSEISKLIGVGRATVYRRIKKLRPYFADLNPAPCRGTASQNCGGPKHKQKST